MSWSGAVMTHPARASNREWFPSWPRVCDDGRGLSANFCATLKSTIDGAEWCVLAQDDVEPCIGLEAGLGRLLSEVPSGIDVVSGFSLAPKTDARLMAQGARWRIRKRGELLWVMLVALRRAVAVSVCEELVDVPRPADKRGGRHLTTGCDERLSIWLDANNVAAATHLPNLVQHRGVQSIAGHGWTIGGRPRQSPTYRDASMAELCGWDE